MWKKRNNKTPYGYNTKIATLTDSLVALACREFHRETYPDEHVKKNLFFFWEKFKLVVLVLEGRNNQQHHLDDDAWVAIKWRMRTKVVAPSPEVELDSRGTQLLIFKLIFFQVFCFVCI